MHLKFGVGAAYLYENLNWKLSNLDQTNYFDNNNHLLNTPAKTTQPGIIGTYETTTSMPYIEIVAGEQTDSFSVLLSLGYSPCAQISDVDNHILRQIYATTNLIGGAYKICAQTKYDITENLFLMAKWDWINFDLTGTENDLTYGNVDYPNDSQGHTWTIDHEISSTQSTLSFSFGAKF
jgi:outer membrane protease